jgi:hypothetical protein
MIEDWEFGALYWNSLRSVGGDEEEANRLVRQRYFDEFVSQKDILFFVGTTKEWHARGATNLIVIIRIFYPPKQAAPVQLSLLPASVSV